MSALLLLGLVLLLLWLRQPLVVILLGVAAKFTAAQLQLSHPGARPSA